jgi:hypothetical protein
MSRGFWGFLMVVSVALAAGSAYVLSSKLAEPEPQPVPLRSVPASEAPVPAEPSPAAALASPASDGAAPAVSDKLPAGESDSTEKAAAADKSAEKVATADKPAATKSTGAKRNVLFKLVRPNAKAVEIIGDFNDWKRTTMKKAGSAWQISLPLTPGAYEYAFVVDGKRIRDPNAKQSSANGKSSIVTVKPLGKHT